MVSCSRRLIGRGSECFGSDDLISGRPASTVFRPLRHYEMKNRDEIIPVTLSEVLPSKKDIHQILVHASRLGHPVFGDSHRSAGLRSPIIFPQESTPLLTPWLELVGEHWTLQDGLGIDIPVDASVLTSWSWQGFDDLDLLPDEKKSKPRICGNDDVDSLPVYL